MNAPKLISLSAAVLGMAIVVLGFVLVPERLATSPSAVITLVVLAASVVLVRLPAVLVTREARTDAGSLAVLGPAATLGIWVIVLAALGFVAALLGATRLGIAADVIAVAVLVSGSLFLRAAMDKVQAVSDAYSGPSKLAGWRSGLAVAAANAVSAPHCAKLAALEEQARYAASDIPGGCPQDGPLEATVAALNAAATSGDENAFAEGVRDFENLMAQRELTLKAARSRT
jgi:hypothetical protein